MSKSYLVQARLKFASAYHTGYDFEVHAANKADAIKRARKEAFNAGHNGKYDGPLKYTAIEI